MMRRGHTWGLALGLPAIRAATEEHEGMPFKEGDSSEKTLVNASISFLLLIGVPQIMSWSLPARSEAVWTLLALPD